MSAVSCSICWEIVSSTCVVSFLVCGHVYHHTCVEKWMKTSKTCPECRNWITETKRVYLNLVNDPETEQLSLNLTNKDKELTFLKTDNEIQNAIIKHIEMELNSSGERLSAKEELLRLSTKTNKDLTLEKNQLNQQNGELILELDIRKKENIDLNIKVDDLTLSMNQLNQQNGELKLELEIQEKENIGLNIQLKNLQILLTESQSENVIINRSVMELRKYSQEQAQQTSDLYFQIKDLTERLDQFRTEFVTVNNNLQVQIENNELIKSERESLLSENSKLIMEVYNLKLRISNNDNFKEITTFAYELLETIRKEYKDLIRQSTALIHSRRHSQVSILRNKIKKTKTEIRTLQNHLKRKRKSIKSHSDLQCLNGDANLKIKLVKSALSWKCMS